MTAAPESVTTFHVSPDGDDAAPGTSPDRPFATLTHARDAIRALKAGGELAAPVTVVLAAGTHRLPEPLTLSPADSGTPSCPVAWTAAPGADAADVVVSGARRVTGWRRDTDDLWVADLPDVAAGAWTFKTLYVDGERRARPRWPVAGYHRVEAWPNADKPPYAAPGDHFTFAGDDLRADWRNLADVEVVTLRYWVSSRQPIAAVDPDTRTVRFACATRYRYSDEKGEGGARYFAENVFEALQPGQWYLDRPAGRLCYRPRPGEDVEALTFEAPAAPQLLRLQGDPEAGAFVTDVCFRGLTFTHNDWMLPDGDAGDGQSAPTVAGAVTARGARRCALESCRLTQLSSYAVQLDEGCQDLRIAGCQMSDLGGGGVRMGGGDAASHPFLRTGGNTIADNHIHHIGQIHHAATGVWIQHSGGNTITHNEIDHTYYSSIAVGWVWGYRPSVSTHNEISFNHLHHVGQGLLSDMGGIYMLGVAPGTVVRNNFLHDIESHGYGGWGIYTDEGSSHVLIEDNVVLRTKCGGFDQHYGRENWVRNNVFALGGEDGIHRSRLEDHISFRVEGNIVVVAGDTPVLGGTWKEHAYHHRPGKPWEAAQETTQTEIFDRNLYWNPDRTADTAGFGPWSFAQWQARGQDAHGLWADPGLADLAAGDVTLAGESPALRLGFRPIDLSTVGPRPPA